MQLWEGFSTQDSQVSPIVKPQFQVLMDILAHFEVEQLLGCFFSRPRALASCSYYWHPLWWCLCHVVFLQVIVWYFAFKCTFKSLTDFFFFSFMDNYKESDWFPIVPFRVRSPTNRSLQSHKYDNYEIDSCI